MAGDDRLPPYTGGAALRPWTLAASRRFWEQMSVCGSKEEQYFSRALKDALVRCLILTTGRLQGASVLDYGCGLGFLLEGLLAAGGRCRGLDASAGAVAAVNRRLGGRAGWGGALVQDGDALAALGEQAFDLVTCVETVEHLDDSDLARVLGDIYRLLRPGGHALFTTPHDEDMAANATYCPFCDSAFHPMQHVRVFTVVSLSAVLKEHGFEVVVCVPTNLFWFQLTLPPSPLDWTLRHLGSLVLRRWYRMLDRLLPRSLAEGRELRRWSGSGPHLIAVVRRPSAVIAPG